MNNKIYFSSELFISSAIVFCCVFLFSIEASAQTARRVSPTPTPEQNSPQIVSRADDYQENRQTIAPESPAENADNLTERIDRFNNRINEIGGRLNSLESNPMNKYDAKQKRLLLNLDILSRSEQRAESLRKQLFEMTEKEGYLKAKLDRIAYDARPEAINSYVAVAGTMRPEELRRMRADSLKREQENLQNLLGEIETTKQNIEFNVQKADALVDKLRLKLEKEIDDALNEEDQ